MPFLRLDISHSLAHLPLAESFLGPAHEAVARLFEVPIEKMKGIVRVSEGSRVGDGSSIHAHAWATMLCFPGRSVEKRAAASREISALLAQALAEVPEPVSTAVFVLETPAETTTLGYAGTGKQATPAAHAG